MYYTAITQQLASVFPKGYHSCKGDRKSTRNLLFHKHCKFKQELWFTVLVSLLLLAVSSCMAQENVLQLLEKEFQKVVASTRPTVVKVVATQRAQIQLQPTEKKMFVNRQNIGSGIIIDTAGHIVTTTFDADVKKIEVIFNNGKSSPAKLIGEDSLTDIAVFHVETDYSEPVARMRPGDSSKINAGSWIVTVGNSYGNSPIISFGIVSGWDTLPKQLCTDVIKINAPVTPGNSGGAVVNTTGEVVGMILAVLTESTPWNFYTDLPKVTEFEFFSSSQGWGNQDITFAIPIETVLTVAKEIIAHGKVRRGWLGVDIKNSESGVHVTKVHQNSPAHKIGLLPRDIILEFDSTPVKSYPELLRCVSRNLPKAQINLKISRNGHERNYVVTLGAR